MLKILTPLVSAIAISLSTSSFADSHTYTYPKSFKAGCAVHSGCPLMSEKRAILEMEKELIDRKLSFLNQRSAMHNDKHDVKINKMPNSHNHDSEKKHDEHSLDSNIDKKEIVSSESVMGFLIKHLELNEHQVDLIHVVLSDAHRSMTEFAEQQKDKVHLELQDILSPEQMSKLTKMHHEK